MIMQDFTLCHRTVNKTLKKNSSRGASPIADIYFRFFENLQGNSLWLFSLWINCRAALLQFWPLNVLCVNEKMWSKIFILSYPSLELQPQTVGQTNDLHKLSRCVLLVIICIIVFNIYSTIPPRDQFYSEHCSLETASDVKYSLQIYM